MRNYVSDRVAVKIIDSLETAVNSLVDLGERGSVPKELLDLGIAQYRQLIVKPYRIIYQCLPDQCVVHAILDGRRDLQVSVLCSDYEVIIIDKVL